LVPIGCIKPRGSIQPIALPHVLEEVARTRRAMTRGQASATLSSESRGLISALAAVTLIRLVVAATAPLAPDEAYYWVWSHALAL
jgi:hypothetical protein